MAAVSAPRRVEPRPIRAQPGAQEAFLSCAADIVIGGGSAGGGKTFALLVEPLRHAARPGFSATILRRETTRITQDGGMWDESARLYPYVHLPDGRPWPGRPRETTHDWTFPTGATVSFRHCEHEHDRHAFNGAQIPLLEFDQLEEFTATIFWHLWGRCRWGGPPEHAITPYVMATCNPVPEDDPTGGWLHKLLQWWIDPLTGLAIPERSGVARWFVRESDDSIDWADARETLAARHPQLDPETEIPSLAFVRMSLSDNPALIAKDPAYRGKLLSLPRVERERMLHGNWNVRPLAGFVFNRAWYDVLAAWPADATGRPMPTTARARYWDKAGSEHGSHWSAGVRIARTIEGTFIVEDVARGQWSAENRERVILQCAAGDPPGTTVWIEQEPGSGGKESAELTVRRLAGYDVQVDRVTGDKLSRSAPFRAQSEARTVKLLAGDWNEAFLRELHNWAGESDEVCDQIDAASGAFAKLALGVGTASLLRIRGF